MLKIVTEKLLRIQKMEQQKYRVGAFFWTQFLVTEIAAAALRYDIQIQTIDHA